MCSPLLPRVAFARRGPAPCDVLFLYFISCPFRYDTTAVADSCPRKHANVGKPGATRRVSAQDTPLSEWVAWTWTGKEGTTQLLLLLLMTAKKIPVVSRLLLVCLNEIHSALLLILLPSFYNTCHSVWCIPQPEIPGGDPSGTRAKLHAGAVQIVLFRSRASICMLRKVFFFFCLLHARDSPSPDSNNISRSQNRPQNIRRPPETASTCVFPVRKSCAGFLVHTKRFDKWLVGDRIVFYFWFSLLGALPDSPQPRSDKTIIKNGHNVNIEKIESEMKRMEYCLLCPLYTRTIVALGGP